MKENSSKSGSQILFPVKTLNTAAKSLADSSSKEKLDLHSEQSPTAAEELQPNLQTFCDPSKRNTQNLHSSILPLSSPAPSFLLLRASMNRLMQILSDRSPSNLMEHQDHLVSMQMTGGARLTCSNRARQTSQELCETVADLAKRLCTEFVDPDALTTFVAGRLVPLEKGANNVRPIGIGENIVGNVLRKDIQKAAGTLQVCCGMKGGCEAAIHAMRETFEKEET